MPTKCGSTRPSLCECTQANSGSGQCLLFLTRPQCRLPGPAAVTRVLMPNFPQQAPALIVQTSVSLPRNVPTIVSHPLVGAQGVVENFQPVRSSCLVKLATRDLR